MKKTITDERINELSKTLSPVIRKYNKLYYVKVIDPRQTSFIWDPKIQDEAVDLVEYTRVPFFSYSYPALWKPSVDEVLVEIQYDVSLIRDCVAFEVVHKCMDNENGEGNYGEAIFYKLKEEATEGEHNPYIPEHLIYLLVTYIHKETLDIYKMALQVDKNSPLGKNYTRYMDEDVKEMIPVPFLDKDNKIISNKEFKITDIEVINNVILLG